MKSFVYIRISLVLAGLLLSWSCSDLKNGLPSPTKVVVKVHPAGWKDTSSSNFHGIFIRSTMWNLSQCRTCHGETYSGGTAGVSCLRCHTRPTGPENCVTCHGSANAAPPKDTYGNVSRSAFGVGAHQAHLLGTALANPVLCSTCHVVPGSYSSPGHITTSGRAVVQFLEALANIVTNEPGTRNYDSARAPFVPSPHYDTTSHSCGSTYCHGDFKNGNPSCMPVWNDTTGAQAACGTCHGDVTRPTLLERALPKTAAGGGTHPDKTTCSNCHGDVVDAAGNIINPSKHINGKLNVFGDERAF